MAASFNPRAILPGSSRASARASTDTNTQDQVSHVDEPEERITLLTRLASESPNPLADLNSLLPISHRFEDPEGFLALCNDLLVLNAQEHSDPSVRSIRIPGTKVLVSPHQFYHAYHLLSQRGRDLNGGILADEPGTGKTHIYVTAALLRALAFESQRAVKLYWSGKGKKKVGRHAEHHLPEGANGRSCPSQKAGEIVCYCVPGSLTRIICDHTPSGVSAIYCAPETWPDILNLVQTSALNPSIYQLCLVHNNAPIRFTRPLQPLVDTLSRGVDNDLRNPSPASYIFITTLDSPRLRNVFSEGALNAGFVVVDEAHQVLRKRDSLTFRMASEFSGNGADIWFVTATPFSGCSLADWIPPMNLIAPGRVAAMEGLVAALENAKSSDEVDDAQDFTDQFKTVFDEKLVVRHFGTSTFFGKPISDVQDIQPRVISRDTPLRHRSAVQELANQIALQDPRLGDPAQRGLLYLVSLFPAAAQLILDDPITFDMAAIRDFVRQVKNRLRIEESEPLRRLADQITQDSPKLDYIREEIHRMDQDKRERERIEDRSSSKFGAGEDLQMKKMVIITPTVVSAVFLYLALIKDRKDVVLIHNWVSSQEKEQGINNFMSLSAAKLVKHNRILIAPFAVAGTGVNLQVASYQILTSPLPDKASQLQAFARTNRSGQRLRPLTHKILALEDSPVDRIVLASHATLEIESDPFQINEPLRVAGNLSLGDVADPTGAVEDHSSSTHASSLGVDDALLLQNALGFHPGPSSDDLKTEETKPESQSDSSESAMGVEDALLLQDAMFFSPGISDYDGPQTYSLFNDLTITTTSGLQNEPVSPMSTHTFQGSRTPEPVSPMSNHAFQGPRTPEPDHTVQDSNSSFGTHWNLTYTPAPRHPLISGAKDVGHRSLPPLPTDEESEGQGIGPSRRWSSLRPPLDVSPPVHIDAGPTLTSRRDRSMSTTPPASRYRVNVNQDNFEIWVSDSAEFSPETDPNSPLEPLSLRLPADFSPTFGSITAVVDEIRRERSASQRGAQTSRNHSKSSNPDDEDDLSHRGHVASPIKRVPGPVPGQRPREYGDDIPDSDRDLGNRPFQVLDLIRIARSTTLRLEGDRFEEDQQDTETLDERRQIVKYAGERSRQPGREFDGW